MDVKIDKLKQIIPEKYILINEPMKKHTTFRIGGPADILQHQRVLKRLKQSVVLQKKKEFHYLF